MELTALHGEDELVNTTKKLILVDPEAWHGGAEYGMTHALCHLDLGHLDDVGESFTADQERQADCLADIRLDLIEWTG